VDKIFSAGTPPATSSSSGKRGAAEREPGIHAGTVVKGVAAQDAGLLLHRLMWPQYSGMDPRVCASLRSAPPWDDEGGRVSRLVVIIG